MVGEQIIGHRIVVSAIHAVEPKAKISRNHRVAKTIALYGKEQRKMGRGQ